MTVNILSKKHMVTWCLGFLDVILLPVLVHSQRAQIMEVCQWEKFEAKCPDDHVIVMTEAIYGRMRIGRCATENTGLLGCQANVIHIADVKCSGRRECTIGIPDEDFESEKPCPQRQNYFKASYECRKVQALDDTRCRQCDYVQVQNEVGYLASAVTSETGCGSTDCPWFISGGNGQHIRVSLIDFSSPNADGGLAVDDVCKVYAVIKEKSVQQPETICGGQGVNREREVYLSQGPQLEIRIMGNKRNSENDDYFLLKYEVFGCPKMSVEGATVEQDGTVAEVTCDTIKKSWSLKCNGTHWIGAVGNCTKQGNTEEAGPFNAEPVFNTTSLIIMAAVAIIICTLVVVIGIVCFKICTHSNRGRRDAHSYEDPPDICHPVTLPRDTYCVTHMPNDGTMSLDRCVTSKVTCKTYSFENGQKNDYEHICDSSIPRAEFIT